jgi:hypothetical protein
MFVTVRCKDAKQKPWCILLVKNCINRQRSCDRHVKILLAVSSFTFKPGNCVLKLYEIWLEMRPVAYRRGINQSMCSYQKLYGI